MKYTVLDRIFDVRLYQHGWDKYIFQIQCRINIYCYVEVLSKAGLLYELLFDMGEDEIPTLPRQEINAPKEINEIVNTENSSRNDNLKTPVIELSNKLAEGPIKDLKKAIGINDRFLYINELFRGDEVMYERSIKTINSFSIWPEAEYWIRRELKTKLGWIDSDATVIQFDQLIKKRFS